MSAATATGLALGYAADAVLGDPRRGHPVALFGATATRLEQATWADGRAAGAAHVGLLVVGVVGATAAIRRVVASRPAAEALLTAAATWVALGETSLRREGAHMHTLLAAGDLAAARDRLPHLCGRDPSALTALHSPGRPSSRWRRTPPMPSWLRSCGARLLEPPASSATGPSTPSMR